MSMIRVSKRNPCPVCRKEDWCLIGKSLVLCMRVSSSMPKHLADGSLGYYHVNPEGKEFKVPEKLKPKEEKFEDFGVMVGDWRHRYGTSSLKYLSKTIGLTEHSLILLECVKTPQHSVWGFPMKNAEGVIIGIRMRHENGRKWAQQGSRNGLFIPISPVEKEIVICEGPTDTAAALSIGIYAIGRFNCCGGMTEISRFIKINRVRRAVIVADCDNDRIVEERVVNPGISGAISLSKVLPIPTCVVALPSKDMRSFVTAGGTAATLKSLTGQLVWNNPN